MSILKTYYKKFTHSSERSKDIVKNSIMSTGAKGATVIASLLLVPMTINYLKPTQYGIWLALSSVIGMVSLFDLGLGNGFRTAPIKIGSNNWIANNCMILKNTRTNPNTVIAAGTFLSKDVTHLPEKSVIGNDKPVRVLSQDTYLNQWPR